MRTDEELERRDTSIETKIAQLDADGIADLAITKIGGGITTLATEVRLFRGAKGGGFELEPAQSFRTPDSRRSSISSMSTAMGGSKCCTPCPRSPSYR